MQYLSSQMSGVVREFPDDTLQDVTEHLRKTFPGGVTPKTSVGDIQDALLAFRTKEGHRLMINQLAPIFLAICWGDPLV